MATTHAPDARQQGGRTGLLVTPAVVPLPHGHGTATTPEPVRPRVPAR